TGRNVKDLVRQINFEEPKPPRRLNPHLPRRLETIVMKAMAKVPAKRYGSASQLAEDLRCFVTGRPPAHAELDGVLERVQSVMRRRIAKVLFGLAALITVAISLAIFLTAHPKSPNTGPLAKINRDLDNGITVTLIGERGLPDYFQWRSD